MTYCYNCMSKMNDEGKCGKCGFSQEYYEIQPHQLMPGYKLRDRYVVGKVLGEGGFGITYIGMDEFFDEKVAIKEFYMTGFVNRNNTYSARVSAETGDKGELFIRNREKFYDEAKVLVKLGREDGIVKVRDFFYENETAYIVMDYLEGKTLKDLLKERKTLSVEETLQMFKPILNALSKVHERNIIHRDISPDNIIITEDGKPWLIDFGAAREFADDDIKSLSVILKPGYAPEEQYRRRGVQGPWTDIYAICATMYRCISGKRPDDALERLAEDETEELCTIAPACPKHLSDVIMKGLSVRQKDRYQSIEELREDLEKEVTEPVYTTQEPEPVLETADAGNNMADEETVMIFATPSPVAKQIEEPVEEVVPVEYATAEPEIIEEPEVYAEPEPIYEPVPVVESYQVAEPKPVETEDNLADEPTEMIFATPVHPTKKTKLPKPVESAPTEPGQIYKSEAFDEAISTLNNRPNEKITESKTKKKTDKKIEKEDSPKVGKRDWLSFVIMTVLFWGIRIALQDFDFGFTLYPVDYFLEGVFYSIIIISFIIHMLVRKIWRQRVLRTTLLFIIVNFAVSLSDRGAQCANGAFIISLLYCKGIIPDIVFLFIPAVILVAFWITSLIELRSIHLLPMPMLLIDLALTIAFIVIEFRFGLAYFFGSVGQGFGLLPSCVYTIILIILAFKKSYSLAQEEDTYEIGI